MMISIVAFPNRFTIIDELTRLDHHQLNDNDQCYFLGEYTAHAGYNKSPTNSLIWNFKKSLDRRGKPEWKYKKHAILRAAKAFRIGLGEDPPPWTFVPIPPSKKPGHRYYDDRITQMLQAIWPDKKIDIRELIIQKKSTETAHGSSVRPTPQQIKAVYRIDKDLTIPEPATIAVVDDVLTTGAHFRAASEVLKEQFPETPILGLFIARRVPGRGRMIADYTDVTYVVRPNWQGMTMGPRWRVKDEASSFVRNLKDCMNPF